MADEYVFRFISMRPLNPKKKTEREYTKTDLYPEAAGRSDFHDAVRRAIDEGLGKKRLRELARTFAGTERYVRRIEDLPFDVGPGLAWTEAHVGDKPAAARENLEKRYEKPVDELIKGAPARESLGRLADTILAETLAPGPARGELDRLTAAHKLLSLLFTLADDPARFGDLTVGDLVAQRVVMVRERGRPPQERPAPEEPPPPDDKEKEEAERLRARIRDLEHAHRELSDLAVKPSAVVQPESRRVEAGRLRALEERINMLAAAEPRAGAKRPRRLPAEPLGELPGTGPIVLSRDALNELSDSAKRALDELKIDLGEVDPVAASFRIEREMEMLGARLASSEAPVAYLMLGGVKLELTKLKESLGFKPAVRPPPRPVPHECEFNAGVGDLLLVRQTLKAYELAEFAHVENVLAGEFREREHRRLNVREEIEVTEEERETEKERDLQSTERNEMQSEAEKTVKSEFGLEAGLQVSGSYGPTVSFSASLNASFSTSSEETTRKAVSYSREVTDRTSERVRERVKRELRRRLLEETQEINKHGINNAPPTNGHIRGIYRWLNKVYDAQIFNYGQRMMFEFVVPEAAAYFLYALIENPPSDIEIEKPDPPAYFGSPLKPSHLTRTNYQSFVAKYQVRNVPAPPPEFQHAAYFDKQDKVEGGSTFARAGKIEVPAGYEAYAATVMGDHTFTSGQGHHFRVMLGNRNFDRTNFWGSEFQNLGQRYRELAVAYQLFNAWSFALGIDVYCRLMSEGLTKWQQQVYDAIVEAYVRQLSQYEEKLAAAAIQKGVQILGRNPLENRRLERDELKKLVLMILTDSTSIARDSYLGGAEPVMDLDVICENGSWIRFFENAFEWNNMLYVLYPYFWGRKPRWITALHLTDPDPDFAAFLKAGAARVQVPVRPGFERAVAHFCQFGEIWEGNDPPLRDDDLYVPIVDEIAANLGKLDDGVPYPEDSEPWEVRIPTSLVLVQNLNEIPGIRDILTGNPVSIEN
jgi:hypothetical protein